MDQVTRQVDILWNEMAEHLSSPEFYIQTGVVAAALVIGCLAAIYIVRHVGIFREEPAGGGGGARFTTYDQRSIGLGRSCNHYPLPLR